LENLLATKKIDLIFSELKHEFNLEAALAAPPSESLWLIIRTLSDALLFFISHNYTLLMISSQILVLNYS
jgi:hypothetical protein